MILCVDIGNSNIVFGCFEDVRLVSSARIATDRNRMSDQYAVELYSLFEMNGVNPGDISGAIISSVVPLLTQSISDAVKKVTGLNPMILSAKLNTGLEIALDNPLELGSDLIADAVAAKTLYTLPVIVIDMGTATTMTVIDCGGRFLGGAIMTGLRTSLDALVSRTSALPGISLAAPDSVIGSNTDDCMKSGAVYGAASMLDGMCERIFEKLGKCPTVIATGGLSGVVIPHCRTEIIRDELLLLKGLSIIYKRNM